MAISQSKEFFINLKEKDIPKWNPKLSYYDQDPYVLEFFQNEWDKINNGVTINGTFIHPWLYYHVNFFKARIMQPGGREVVMSPPLDDHAWYFKDNYQDAEEQGKGVCLFGTRGFTKTVIEASVASWTSLIKPNSIMSVNGGSKKDLDDVCDAIKLSNNLIHPAFKLPILTEDWKDKVVFGFREANDSTVHSTLQITNLEGAKQGASEKAAGGTIGGLIADEIGKFDPRDFLNAVLPKVRSQYGSNLVHILSGTGGNSELSEGAKIILENPDDYFLIRMNWDRLDNSIPEEAITWKKTRGTSFCTFVPGQMSYRLEVLKQETTLADYVKKPDDKDLKKIKLFKTDWLTATKFLNDRLESLQTDDAKNKQRMYHPMETTDCFLTDSPNPFNVARAQKKLLEVKQDPKYRLVDLQQNFDGTIKVALSSKKIAEREYKNKDTDAPIMMFEDAWDDIKLHENVAGGDDYKLTSAKESTSLATMYVLGRRNIEINTPLERILACVATRPHDSHNIVYDQFKMMLKHYKALCNLEAIDTGFASYLETIGLNMMDYLCPNINPAQDLTSANKKKANSRFGTYPTPANIKIMYQTVLDYTEELVTIGFDDNNEPIQMYGMDFIEDPFLLEEIIAYHPGGNFDRIVGFGWALVYSRYLDKKNIQPRKNKTYSDEFYNRNSQNIKAKKQNSNFDNFSRVKFQNF